MQKLFFAKAFIFRKRFIFYAFLSVTILGCSDINSEFKNKNTIPKIIYPGDIVQVKLTEIMALEGKWAGDNIWIQPEPVALKDSTKIKWQPAAVSTNYNMWGSKIITTDNSNIKTPVWIKFQIPSDFSLYGKKLDFYIEMDVKYVKSRFSVNTIKNEYLTIKKNCSILIAPIK